MPERTCAGCQGKDEKEKMMRVVKHGEQVAVDARQNMPGRGGYVHAQAACIERAEKRGGLARTLAGGVPKEVFVALRAFAAAPGLEDGQGST